MEDNFSNARFFDSPGILMCYYAPIEKTISFTPHFAMVKCKKHVEKKINAESNGCCAFRGITVRTRKIETTL